MGSGIERRWFLPIFIVVGVVGAFFISGRLGLPASAQGQLQAAAENGIIVVPVQIARDSYGLAMVDTVSQTMWVYELNSRGPAHSRLRLLAARSWRYDRLLQELNTAEPRPKQIKMLLEEGWKEREEKREEKQKDDVNILEIAEPNSSNLGI